MRYAGALLSIVLAPSLAFARGEGPEENEPKKTPEPAPTGIREAFTTSARPGAIETTACALRPSAMIDGRQRVFDVRVGEKHCVAETEGSIPLQIHVTDRDDGKHDVALEVEPPADASRDEIRDVVVETGHELERRLSRTASTPIVIAPPEEENTLPKTRWYGWQTLIADGSAALSCATIFLCPAGLAIYAFGPPIIHWLHGHVERGFISLGIRLVIPGAATGIGFAISAATCSGFFCDTGQGALIGLGVGLIAGAVIAPIVDAVGLTFEEVPAKTGLRIVPFGIQF